MNVPTPHASWPTELGRANSDHRLTLATHRPTPFKGVYTELSFASYVVRGSNVSPYIGLIHTIQYETRQEQGLSLLLPSLTNDESVPPRFFKDDNLQHNAKEDQQPMSIPKETPHAGISKYEASVICLSQKTIDSCRSCLPT